jgi:hypothetical protein
MTGACRAAAGGGAAAAGIATASTGPAAGAAAGAAQARSPRAALLAAALTAVLTAVLAAGCGSTAVATPARASAAAIRLPLVTSLTVPSGASWAVVDMGGSAAAHENFWQLISRPAGAAKWSLATPPGVADNGGLVGASLGGGALAAGFNPSQDLTFSPLAVTRDGGAHWAPALLPAGLAAVPSALAAGPGGRLIALTNRGVAEISAPGGTGWTRLASLASLAATPAGRSCGLRSLTAAAFSLSGRPLLAGQCAAPGVAGIFAYAGGSWQLAGPAMPAALAQRRIGVLRLTTAGNRTLALLTAIAPGGAPSLTAGWASGSGRWTLSEALQLGSARVLSTASGSGAGSFLPLAGSVARPRTVSAAGVILSTGQAETVADGGNWQHLPALPRRAVTLVLGPGRQIGALAPSGSALTSWRLSAAAGTHAVTWTRTQAMKVPLPFGSSG